MRTPDPVAGAAAASSSQHGKTALITGASAGIGAAFARAYAARGFDLLLTARRGGRLDALARELEARHGIRAVTVAADLADPGAPEVVMEAAHRHDLDIEILVNNAGYAIPEAFMERPWSDQAQFIQVMMTAVAHMTHLVLPRMIERGSGSVIHVASVAGFMPGTIGATLYGPSKAFLIKFSEALFLELDGTGVHVLALCPGFTYSEFHDVTGTRESVNRMPRFMWMTADAVVAEGIETVMKGRKPVHVPGAVNKMLTGLARVLPDGALLALSRQRARLTGNGEAGKG